jgi:hypothetical protein
MVRVMRRHAVLVGLLLIAGCSDSEPGEPRPQIDGGQALDDAGGDRPDAAEGDPTWRRSFRYTYRYAADGPFKTTAQACAASAFWGDVCGTCAGGPAAPGVAAAYAGGSDTPTKVLDCDAVPTSPTGPVSSVGYCCETPFIEIEGPTASPRSCDSVCAGESLICTMQAPIYDGFGGSPQPGSGLLNYGDSSNATTFGYSNCAFVPTATKLVDGTPLPLHSHICACVDPDATLPPPP